MDGIGPAAAPKAVEAPRLIDFKGDILTVKTSAPLPQGLRLDFSLPLEKVKMCVSIKGKVVSITPIRDGEFCVAIRCHSLKKNERQALFDEINNNLDTISCKIEETGVEMYTQVKKDFAEMIK